ncbi:MAG TPA: hypothetical protein VGL11_10360 [Candidatus Binatia bacterium]
MNNLSSPFDRLRVTDPYPLRLLSDPKADLIRAAGVANEGHWAGLISHPVTFVVDRQRIVRWIYTGDSASDRPSPVALAKTAVMVARGEPLPEEHG